MKIRTRYAPSPTGRMHVGNLRTALYAYLIAKHEGGDFILRIEDTDQERYVEGAVEIIYRTLEKTGLIHDEGPDKDKGVGPYVQSERQASGIYLEYAKKLIEKGEAYYCFCDKERLATLNQTIGGKEINVYDKHCLHLSKEEVEEKLASGIPYVIRQNNPTEGTTTFQDEIYGDITVDNSELDDMILIKSDGYPTYNFANVVDDHLMGITHVVRGNEYLSSSPKYNRLYEAFGWEVPVYVHCPLITDEEHHKLSKRCGHSSYEDLIEQGFLSDAVVNFVALLGWSPEGTEEIFSLEELTKAFDYKHISKSPAVFDYTKLKWMNGEYMKAMDFDTFYAMAEPYLKETITKDMDLKKIAEMVKTRIEVFPDIKEMVDFFEELPTYDIAMYTHKKMKTTTESSLEVLEELLPIIEEQEAFDNDSLYQMLVSYVEKKGCKNGYAMWPVRTAVSGKQMTPAGATEIMEILGKEESIARIKKGIELLKMPNSSCANKAQALAIEHASDPIQVLAGPGSGKTYLTIRRIRHLICHHGISPDKILVITFTKAAAAEMEERFRKLTDNAYQEVVFGTFHSVYFHILKQSGYGKTELVSNKDQWKYIMHILNAQGILNADKELISELLQCISKEKNKSAELISDKKSSEISSDEKIEEKFPDIFKEYRQLMQEENKIDFDDMILLCDRLLTEKADALSYWQKRFSHILVDEFQDIGALQYRVLKKLAAPENNLFVVGDDDQSIYGFRGAEPDIMRQFMADYPDAVQYKLEMNYRCGSDIVKKSQLLIAENQKRFPKEIRAAKAETGEVGIKRFDTQEEEYAYLIQCIKQMSTDELEQSAVIGRTNTQLAGLSRRLVKEEIPFIIKSKTENIFTHDTAKDILAYLHFANDYYNGGDGKGKRSDFLRIRNKPCRYISREALKESEISKEELLAYYKEKPYMQDKIRDFFAQLKRVAAFRPYLAIDYVRKTIGYDQYCCEGKGVEERKKQMERLDEIQQTALACHSLEEWEAYIAEYTEKLEKSEKTEKAEKEQGKKKSGIHLATMHGSKGLEYENVFLIDVKKGILPSRKAVSQEQIEEERRILYVAMTRAKSRLEILYWGEGSCFLGTFYEV